MPYSAYVDAALYDESDGFYASGGKAGRRGDFITSPEVGPLFGAVLGRWIDAVWRRLGSPGELTVLEAGAGPGTLARAVLAGRPECSAAVRYLAVERSAAQRSSHPEGVETTAELPDRNVGPGVVVANELLDNLPFDLFEARGGAWVEVRVGRSGHRLVEVAEPSTPTPPGLPDARAVPEGARLPVQARARAWVEAARRAVSPGVVLAIDYVASARDLLELPQRSWLRTYRSHEVGADPLLHPGTTDITVPVVLDQLPRPDRADTQADFLRRHGIDELVEEGRRVWRDRATTGDLAALRGRSRVSESDALLDETSLGGFTALQWFVHTDP